MFQYQVELQEEDEVGFTVVGTVSHPTMEYHLKLEAEMHGVVSMCQIIMCVVARQDVLLLSVC